MFSFAIGHRLNELKTENQKVALENYKLITLQKEELKLLQKVTEGNNLFAIEKSLKMSIDEIKINFRRIFEKLFELSKNEVVRI